MLESIHDRARGRWQGILTSVGFEPRFLTGKHMPCPICGGKDRFRWDDKAGTGSFICSHCGAGNGVDLVMKYKQVDFRSAKTLVEQHIGEAPVRAPKAEVGLDRIKEQLANLWRLARLLDGQDIASRYLLARGIDLPSWPTELRYLSRMPHKAEDGVRSEWPGMLARFTAPDGKSATLHRTWLQEPGEKAPLKGEERMMMPGPVPCGGAVRLGPVKETMGVAEGIETALSASILFDVPVWSALTKGGLAKWKAPEGAKHIIIFADRDASYAGQNAAYSLAHRLSVEGKNVEVRMPDREEGKDFNDLLTKKNPRPG
jgi:putative DNA primase/helicase